jgi:predicted dehydrogenase
LIQRALVVGLGSIGRRHLRLLREALPTADIRVLRHSGCGAPIEHADGCFDRLDAASVFAPELALIASPAPFHLSAARVLGEAGAHLLVEKPVSDTADGVANLIALCAARARVFQVGYNLRFLETLQVFRDRIAAGQIGAVQAVRCEIGQYLPGWRPDVDYRDTVSARRALGGGVLLELSHDLDMLRWVFGEVEWLSAWTGRQGMLEIDVEDCAMLQMGFDAGPVAQLSMDFLRRDTTRTCTAIGAEGSLRWDAVTGQVARYDLDSGAWIELSAACPDRDFTYRAQIETFLAAIDGRSGDVAAQGTDGLAVMRLIDAARLSDAQQGRRITLREMT